LVDVGRENSIGDGPVVAAGLALIFDLDGVIVDSMPMHRLSWDRYLKLIGVPATNVVEKMHGRRNDEIFRDFLGAGPTDEEILEHGAAKERVFRDMIRDRLTDYLVPGIAEFLASIQNTPMALATNAERPNADFVLDNANLRHYFRAIVDGSQVEKPKPAPDVYLRAARELRVHPRNCIVFEDSAVGVTSARAAGARVAGILTQKAALADVEISVPDFRAPELLTWLAAQEPKER